VLVFLDVFPGRYIKSGEWTMEEYNYRAVREIAYRISNLFEWDYEGGVLE